MSQTNQTLATFVRSIPLTDYVAALQALVIYDTKNGQFDDFIYTIMPLVNYNMVSPLYVLLSMTRLNDGTTNVARFTSDAVSYIPTLISIPTLFCEYYSEDRLFNEFVSYAHEHSTESAYITGLISQATEREATTVEFFLRVMNNFVFQFTQARFYDCISYLNDFTNVLSVKLVRHGFCQSPYFFQMMMCLFQKSILPCDNRVEFVEFFGEDPPQTIQRNKLASLESLLSSYHQKLSGIIRLCLLSETKYKTFDFIRGFMFQIKANVQNEKFLMTSYNFESTLMHLAFMVQSKWMNVNPLTPYMPNSLAPIRDEPELALPGRESWVDEDNTRNASSFRNLIDNEDPDEIEAEKEQWNQILIGLKTEPDPISQFFFATLQATDLVSANFVEFLMNLARALHFQIDPAINEAPEFQKPMLIARKKAIEHLSFAMTTLLLLKFRSDKSIEFLEATLALLQRTANYDERLRQLPTRPPLAYQHLPEYILASTAKLILFFYRHNVIRDTFPFILKFSSLFSKHRFVRNPTIGDNIVHFFAEIASEPVGGNCHLVVADTVLDQMYPAVVEFYSRVQVTGTHSEYYDRMNMRGPCVKLITFWLLHQECREYFIKHYQLEANRSFLFYLIEDSAFYISNCLDSFIRIRETRKMKCEAEKIIADIESIRNDLKNELPTAQTWMKLVMGIAQFAPFAFKGGNIASKFPQFVLFVLNRASDPESLNIENPEELDYDPNYFLTTFSTLVALMISDKEVVESFTKSSVGYSNELIDKILAALKRLPRTQDNENLFNRFSQFAQMTKTITEQNAITEINIDDAPDEVLDPITYNLMTDPVLLPTGSIFDRATLDQIIMNGLIDPISQVPFKLEEVKPAVERKQFIDNWIAEQRIL